MNKILVAKDIHRVYQDGKRKLRVLNGIDFSLELGENMVILGSSGSGKSTLLHILGALDKPSKGEVLIDGVSVYKKDDIVCSKIRNEHIGFVFQFYHLLPEFNALENVIMPGLVRDASSITRYSLREKAKELLKIVGLSNRVKHRPSELSGGEAQRVAIARALINDPKVVLCDEPTGNLDQDNSLIVLDLIKRLNKEKNISFVVVTHEQEHAKTFTNAKYLHNGVFKPR